MHKVNPVGFEWIYSNSSPPSPTTATNASTVCQTSEHRYATD